MDYYELLGVHRFASDAEIKRAYRRLSFAYHPDKNPSADAEELYKQINAAYDVLGDPEKRRAYDLRGAYQFDVEPQQPEPPRHRDPRYRRRPTNTAATNRSDKYTPLEVMAICMKYLVWVNRAGLVLTLVYVLDFYLPYSNSEEIISSYNAVYSNSGRYKESYVLLTTWQGTTVKIRNPEYHSFEKGQAIKVERTRIYSTMMWINSEGQEPLSLGVIYGALAMFPVGVLIASSIALIFRKRPHLSFNLSIISAVFLLITLFLILFL